MQNWSRGEAVQGKASPLGRFHDGGYEEFVVIDGVLTMEKKYVLIAEAKRESLGAAVGQCLLSMKDMGDSNHGGVVNGSITTGHTWRVLSYDGASFQVSERLFAMFESMGEDKERWTKDYSLLVDCMRYWGVGIV